MPYAPEPFPDVPGVEVEHRFVDAAGLRMHVAVAGSGPPLVLLHGWPQHWWSWRRVLPRLAQRFTCYMPDQRGLGWTEAPEAPEGYRKDQLQRDLVACLDALGLDRVALVGHDWGAWVGYLTALAAPERLTGYLAFSIPPPVASPFDPKAILALPAFAYQPVVAAPGLGMRVMRGGRLTKLLLQIAVTDRSTWDPGDLEAYARPLQRPDRAWASVQYYRQFLLHEAGPQFRGVRRARDLAVPNHLVIGRQDPINVPSLLTAVSHEVVDGYGHFLPEEAPQLVADAILARLG